MSSALKLRPVAIASVAVIGAAAVAIVAIPADEGPRAAERRAMEPADIGRIPGVGDPQLTPDGSRVAYVVRHVDLEADRNRSEIWVAAVDGDDEPIEVGEGSAPRWSPDGKTLAFRGKRGERSGLWVQVPGAGEARFVAPVHGTDHFLGHTASKNYAWSPDGKHLAYVGAEGPAPQPDSDVEVYTRVLYKTRTAFSDGRHAHIWVVPVEGGDPKLLTPGDHSEHALTWSPDSARIAFVSNRTEDPDLNHNDDLWVVDVGSGETTRLTETPGTEIRPTWSPDGQSIAYQATQRPLNTKDSPPENPALWVLPSAGGEPKRVATALDRRIRRVAWAPDSASLVITHSDRGSTPIRRVTLATDTITDLTTRPGSYGSFSQSGDGSRLAYTRAAVDTPAEIWLAAGDGSKPRRLTHVTDSVVDTLRFQDAETFWFETFDGTQVQGWVMKPVGFSSGTTYPAVLNVHGGPHGMYGQRFDVRMQLLASAGYGVVYINPRGSTGYGQAFADGTIRAWGDGDYQDLMKGLDHALQANPWIDPERLGVMGGSYGGFMTNWIVTQTSRFKAAVARASVSNLVSFYGTSLYQLLIEVEFAGLPWDDYDVLWKHSPLAHIANATTPTMLTHGVADHDVPITQAEEMFIALRKRGIDATLVRYPGQGHGIRRPSHRVDEYTRIRAWFDRYLSP